MSNMYTSNENGAMWTLINRRFNWTPKESMPTWILTKNRRDWIELEEPMKCKGGSIKTNVKVEHTTLLVTVECPVCGRSAEPFSINKADWAAWRGGQSARRAFPDLTAAQREILVSGTCSVFYNRFQEPGILSRADLWDQVETNEIEIEDTDYEVAADINAIMQRRGFGLIETGGHCTAFYKRKENGEITLVTCIQGHCVPESWTEEITVGEYPDEDSYNTGDLVAHKDYPNILAYLASSEVLAAARK
jgi:hypothetical protein